MLEIKTNSTRSSREAKEVLKTCLNFRIINIHDCLIISDEPLTLSETEFSNVLTSYGGSNRL